MITYFLFNKNTAAERVMAELAERVKKEQLDVEVVDADSPRGIDMTQHYDVLGRPAVILARGDGSPVQVWQGEDGLPAPSEIAYLARQ